MKKSYSKPVLVVLGAVATATARGGFSGFGDA
jgi:hypothetical protein